MPWKETCVMDERVEFIGMYLRGDFSMLALCREFGISRTTGYKYMGRYREGGIGGLLDRSRAPLRHPNAIPEGTCGEYSVTSWIASELGTSQASSLADTSSSGDDLASIEHNRRDTEASRPCSSETSISSYSTLQQAVCRVQFTERCLVCRFQGLVQNRRWFPL